MTGLEPQSLYEGQLYARLQGLEPIIISTPLEKEWQSLSVRLFPNPARDILSIQMGEAEQGSETYLRLYNPAGQLLQQQAFRTQTELNLVGLSRGIYLVHLRNGNQQTTARIWVQ